jgi:uncharacterized membrane protein YjgN (DUF898 family)
MADPCPRCGFAEVSGDRCPQCGVVIATYQSSLEKMRRGPQPGGVSPFARGPAPRPAALPDALASAAAPTAPVTTAAAGPGGFTPPRPAQPAARSAAPTTTGSRHVIFRGSGGSLFGIHVINALLILATLGVYYFWAKVRVRNYLWSESEFEGDRFAYHGTGRELIIGFAKAALFFFLPVTLLNMLPELFGASPVVIIVTRMLVSILAAVFIPIAIVGARRYRLSRTSWRGIRFSLRASTSEFARLWIRGWLLIPFTLGLYYPWFIVNQQRFLTSHSWFGSERFSFDGRGRDLLPVWFASVLLFVPTLGLSWFWFAAKRQRYYAEHTRVAGARFRSTVTGAQLAWLTISTWVGLVCTVGLAWPWLTVRRMRRTFEWLSLDGPLALESITQQAQQVNATGEGLAGFFDADLGFT